jgi:hypothetical protein
LVNTFKDGQIFILNSIIQPTKIQFIKTLSGIK